MTIKLSDIEQALDIALHLNLPNCCEDCEKTIHYNDFSQNGDFLNDVTDVFVAQLKAKGVEVE